MIVVMIISLILVIYLFCSLLLTFTVYYYFHLIFDFTIYFYRVFFIVLYRCENYSFVLCKVLLQPQNDFVGVIFIKQTNNFINYVKWTYIDKRKFKKKNLFMTHYEKPKEIDNSITDYDTITGGREIE